MAHTARMTCSRSWPVARAWRARALTAARLDILRAMAGVEAVEIETSQHTAGFYQRFGFEAVRVLADGFGPGLDGWEMTLALDHTVRRDGVD